ncbi:CAP domain-containing protein [Pelotalea chapellei]|uniref:CAP domain-containing protein n=1 Tax=Pelotalea chapellei TaxID=44671 RepID=A0ABS5UC37_9BACT|nr:CAP domain-containing protein [Pelotalea chapellei]MBT1073260.1 CAP domain-containing protein [Pelotalea chapellei]
MHRFCNGYMRTLLIWVWCGVFLSGVTFTSPASAGQFEQDLLVRINSYRAAHKLQPLAASDVLEDLARKHSREMEKSGNLSHDGFKERFERSGSHACVENVGWNHETSLSQFTGWKSSPGHDKNMLSKQITKAGIDKTGPYVTFFACK